ncbi:hypothetical protein K469DRAFT_586400, partial [Zopfia rhizophila CBS 207.26]
LTTFTLIAASFKVLLFIYYLIYYFYLLFVFYINNILQKYLNCFYTFYINNILVYSYTCAKYKEYFYLILKSL